MTHSPAQHSPTKKVGPWNRRRCPECQANFGENQVGNSAVAQTEQPPRKSFASLGKNYLAAVASFVSAFAGSFQPMSTLKVGSAFLRFSAPASVTFDSHR